QTGCVRIRWRVNLAVLEDRHELVKDVGHGRTRGKKMGHTVQALLHRPPFYGDWIRIIVRRRFPSRNGGFSFGYSATPRSAGIGLLVSDRPDGQRQDASRRRAGPSAERGDHLARFNGGLPRHGYWHFD